MYDKKEQKYFENIRTELLELIPNENKNGNMLEIGAGGGNTLIYAKENSYAKNIYGIELFQIKNSNQNSSLFSGFIIGDIEKIPFPFENKKFDVILLADVLEHLIDPYTILNKLKKHLNKNGIIVASIPNIREWNTMKTIFFKGDFKYTDSGILDKTHLRFFTKKNMINLFENNDFEIVKILGSNSQSIIKYRRQFRFIKLFFFLLFEEFKNIQYFIVAKNKNQTD